MVRQCSSSMHLKPTVLPLTCHLIGHWRPNEVTLELPKVLVLKCANLDGPTVLFITPLFWYVSHVERSWSKKIVKLIECSSSVGVIWNIRFFIILLRYGQKWVARAICKQRFSVRCFEVFIICIATNYHNFLMLVILVSIAIWENGEVKDFLTWLKTFCRDSMVNHTNWQYGVH
jgi:hypothetical protein